MVWGMPFVGGLTQRLFAGRETSFEEDIILACAPALGCVHMKIDCSCLIIVVVSWILRFIMLGSAEIQSVSRPCCLLTRVSKEECKMMGLR